MTQEELDKRIDEILDQFANHIHILNDRVQITNKVLDRQEAKEHLDAVFAQYYGALKPNNDNNKETTF